MCINKYIIITIVVLDFLFTLLVLYTSIAILFFNIFYFLTLKHIAKYAIRFFKISTDNCEITWDLLVSLNLELISRT